MDESARAGDPLAHITVASPEPTPSAEKSRRYRARKKEGGATLIGELTGEQVRKLIEAGWIDKRDIKNPRAVGADLVDLGKGWKAVLHVECEAYADDFHATEERVQKESGEI